VGAVEQHPHQSSLPGFRRLRRSMSAQSDSRIIEHVF
jgi:hypothetical protein